MNETDYLNRIVSFAGDTNMPPSDSATLANVLWQELTANGNTMPDETRATLIGVAAGLLRNHFAEFVAEATTQQLLDRLRNGK